MTRALALMAALAVLLFGCGTTQPAARSSVPVTSTVPSSPGGKPAAPASVVPAGRILAYRMGSDGLEHYFTINTDGSDERELFSADGCGCARFSPDGTRIVTMGATGLGTWSLMTMRPDGTDQVVVTPPIETLTLAQPMPNSSFSDIAFSGWDDTRPSRAGLYLAAPDLSDLRQVHRLPEGVIGMEPFGVTPDGSRVLFFSETGPDGGMTHAGDLYVIEADGSGLRQLNPAGAKVGFVDLPTGSLSPDGRHAAFAVDDAVYVVDVDGGAARAITDRTGFAWAVSWSPTGEWIAYTRQHGRTSVVSLVRPDGSDDHEISAPDDANQAASAVWSPDGLHLLVQRNGGAPAVGQRDLWIMNLDGAFIGQVTHEPSTYGSTGWAPPIAAP